jgi:hypothetical protein
MKSLLKSVFVVSFLGLGASMPASAAADWKNVKLSAVYVDAWGGMTLVLDQNINTLAGCPTGNMVLIPKWIVSVNMTLADPYLARMQALAQSAMIRGAMVNLNIESNYGCQWGVPVAVGITENKQ